MPGAVAEMGPAEGLRPIHLPDPPFWWPPAPGWWLLAVVTVLSLAALWLLRRWRRRTAVRRLALQELLALQEAFAQHTDDQRLVSALSALLRRVAIATCQERHAYTVHALTGADWLRFLDQNWPEQPFQGGIGRLLIALPYHHPQGMHSSLRTEERTALLALCQRWLTEFSLPGRLKV